MCYVCVANRDGCSLTEGRKKSCKKRDNHNLNRIKKFQIAANDIQQNFDFVGVEIDEDVVRKAPSICDIAKGVRQQLDSELEVASSTASTDLDDTASIASSSTTATRKEARAAARKRIKLTLEHMEGIFKPIHNHLIVKRLGLLDSVESATKYMEWYRANPTADISVFLAQGDIHGDRVDELLREDTSFAAFGDPITMRLAADYSDEWFATATSKLRVYYYCNSRGAWYGSGYNNQCCNSLTTSDAWTKLDPNAPMDWGQRWYCPACRARYSPKRGCIAELCYRGPRNQWRALCCLTPFLHNDIRSIKFALIEEQFEKYLRQNVDAARTPEELYNAIPTVRPLAIGTVWKKALPNESVLLEDTYRLISGESDDPCNDLPWMDWNQLYNLGSVRQATAAHAANSLPVVDPEELIDV